MKLIPQYDDDGNWTHNEIEGTISELYGMGNEVKHLGQADAMLVDIVLPLVADNPDADITVILTRRLGNGPSFMNVFLMAIGECEEAWEKYGPFVVLRNAERMRRENEVNTKE
jgi:hypothetical protein